MRGTLAERFEAKVDRSGGEDACHYWTAAHLPRGYGLIGAGGKYGKQLLAHRVAWELAHGMSVPEGLFVLHSCDEPRCVNERHLSVGTHQQNLDQMKARNRHPGPRMKGKEHPLAKISEETVLEMRRRYSGGRGQLTALSREFGMSKSQTSRILRGTSWGHL